MENNNINTVMLSKGTYDNMRNANDRANMLINEIIKSMEISDTSNDLSVDEVKIISAVEILYPEMFKKKVSCLKSARTKNMNMVQEEARNE